MNSEINLDALFKISQGVYLTGARDENNRLIGSCIDSVMVVEVDPAQVIVSLNKASYTCQNVLKNGCLTLSVLPKNTSNELIQKFGTQTSRDIDKWDEGTYEIIDDLPFLKEAVAVMVLKVKNVQETSGHFVFLCDVLQVIPKTMEVPLLYADYQSGQKTEEKKWFCPICGYVYDEETPFEALPDDWVCPLCLAPKSVFEQQ
jgi:flavin reductase (DIM6/NTAB) family NADH-FMN oxidoreductase RutF